MTNDPTELPPIEMLDEASRAAECTSWNDVRTQFGFRYSTLEKAVVAHARTLSELASLKPEPLSFDPDFAAECVIRHAVLLAHEKGEELTTIPTDQLIMFIKSMTEAAIKPEPAAGEVTDADILRIKQCAEELLDHEVRFVDPIITLGICCLKAGRSEAIAAHQAATAPAAPVDDDRADWLSKLAELQMWTRSAWLAGEKTDESEASLKCQLYGFLCGLIGYLDAGAEQTARIEALKAEVEDWRGRLASQCGETMAAQACTKKAEAALAAAKAEAIEAAAKICDGFNDFGYIRALPDQEWEPGSPFDRGQKAAADKLADAIRALASPGADVGKG